MFLHEIMVSNSKRWFKMSRTIKCNKICKISGKNIYEVKKGHKTMNMIRSRNILCKALKF